MVGFRHFRLVGWERLGQPELRAKVSWRSFSSKLVKDITEIVIQQQSESLRILNIERT
jgi:hypothetical protein